MLSLDTRLITAKDDTLWEHNNPGISQVYGSQLTTLINMVFNEEPLIEKQFIDLSYRADQPFDRIWIYNDRYSTGNQTLSEQRGFTTYSGAPSTLQRNHRDKWSINKFTSYLTTTPTTDGDFIEPSAQNTDFLLTQYSIQPVQGRYAFINFYNDTAPITLEDVEIFYRKAQL